MKIVKLKFDMVQAGSDRAAIQASLLALAEGYLAKWDSADNEVLLEENGCVAKRTYDADGVSVVMSKWKCDGLTMEIMKPAVDDFEKTASQLVNKITMTELEQDQGHNIYHVQIDMPMFVSNRSIISC